MIYVVTSFISSSVGWSVPNRVARTTLSLEWAPCAMARVDSKETLSATISVVASAREGVAPPHAMT